MNRDRERLSLRNFNDLNTIYREQKQEQTYFYTLTKTIKKTIRIFYLEVSNKY
jgi:hypothetical protein